MRYGYFHDENKEYVITRPDTPVPWSNYLGSMEYGALITNNAAGYSFIKPSAEGRILRFRFNALTPDMPGRYIYIKDQESKDYWSASWQPIGKDLSEYESTCRHGTAYTIISSNYKKIETETLFYVPLNRKYEVWSFKIKNSDVKNRRLSIFGFAEFTNHHREAQDMGNLQYSQFISRTYFKNNFILQSINELSAERTYQFFGVSRHDVAGWDGSREDFIGSYRSYSNPLALINGKCSNSLNYTGNSCGSIQIDIDLASNTEEEIVFILGAGDEEIATNILNHYKTKGVIEQELADLKKYWHSKLETFQVKTPDENFNSMMNVWHSYECFVNTFWSRTASLIYSNMRNGLGYRDTIADIQSIMHLDHKLARERLVTILSGQVSIGAALPLVSFKHNPGNEPVLGSLEYTLRNTGYEKYRCDDALWLFQAVPQFIKESGEMDFIDKIIPYSDQGEGTVYDHLKRALVFSLERLGPHNLVLGIDTDWNDCLQLGDRGESVFATFQLYLGLYEFKKFAAMKNLFDDVKWAESNREKLYASLQKYCWEDDQFVRAFTKDNYVIGSAKNSEASLWLNPQTWSVISGVATPEQAEKALDKVYNILRTKYGAMLFYPSFKEYGLPIAKMILYLPGIKENASVFLMAEAWIILAETILGHGNKAWEYYRTTNPASQNDIAELRQTEPYVYSQFIDGIESPNHGRSHGHWLTGSASSIMTAVVEGILGIRADYDGLTIDPCIPSDWKEFEVFRTYREKKIDISIKNPDGVEKGVKRIIINGESILNSCTLPLSKIKEKNIVEVIMG